MKNLMQPSLDLFSQLKTYRDLHELVLNAEAENQYLECKAPSEPRLSRDQRKQLAEAISGFANTAGGIIIYGISTTKHQHTGLDILSEIEPIGKVVQLEQQIHRACPQVTNPPVLNLKTRIIKESRSHTRGVLVVHIPASEGDPVQSALDQVFYFRTGDDFKAAPYDLIKRLFAATDTPDLYAFLDSELVGLKEDGKWKIPIVLSNRSSAIAEHVQVIIEILNPEACEHIEASGFTDESNVNPGKCIFIAEPTGVLHKGLNRVVGHLHVKMQIRKRPRRRIDIAISVYAHKMRAKEMKFALSLLKSGFHAKRIHSGFVY